MGDNILIQRNKTAILCFCQCIRTISHCLVDELITLLEMVGLPCWNRSFSGHFQKIVCSCFVDQAHDSGEANHDEGALE